MKKNWRHLSTGDFRFSELTASNIIRKVCSATICVRWEHFTVIRQVVKWPLSSSFSLFPSKALLTLHRLLNQNLSNNYIFQVLCACPQMTPKWSLLTAGSLGGYSHLDSEKRLLRRWGMTWGHWLCTEQGTRADFSLNKIIVLPSLAPALAVPMTRTFPPHFPWQ